MKCLFCGIFVLVLGGFAGSLSAAPLKVGEALPLIVATNQFGTPFRWTTNVQFLLVATEMNCAKAANHRLAEQGPDFLATNRAAFLMDVHTMPAVARWFAFPKLRKYPHKIVLVDAAETLSSLPTGTNAVTILKVTTAGRLEKVSFWQPASQAATACFR